MSAQVQAGNDGWLFLTGEDHQVVDLYRAESAFTPAMANGWVELLRDRADQFNSRGVEYIHVAAPDKLTLLNRHYDRELENSAGSPILQLVRGYEAQLPNFLNVVPYLSQGVDKHQLFWKTDSRWTAWGCFMAYQMICHRLKIPTNTDILNYPFLEKQAVLALGRYEYAHLPETVRTYRLNRYSSRVYANQAVRYRENQNLDRLIELLAVQVLPEGNPGPKKTDERSLNLQSLIEVFSEEHGSHVIYRNESAEAIDKRIVLFGDSYADTRPHLLTGMLAETVRELHFIWSGAVDHEYVRQVRADIVITETAEACMTEVPVDEGNVRQWEDQRLTSLEAAVEQAARMSDETTTLPSGGKRSRRTHLLGEEVYQLDPPIMVQEARDEFQQELVMQSLPVSMVELDDSRLYFSGVRCLLRSNTGRKILSYSVDASREKQLMYQQYQYLPGRAMLLAPSPGAHCYYHWMLDILPRLGLLQRQGNALENIDHFLVRKITGKFQIETLAILGIDESRIVETVGNQYLHCENLLHVDLNNGINMKMHRFIPLWLKQLFLRDISISDDGFLGKPVGGVADQNLSGNSKEKNKIRRDRGHRKKSLKLYVGRPEGVRRGLLNEEQIKPVIEAAGFTMVVMEGMSVAEQVALFSRADALMAPHGGALTNMVFCRPGIPVIEILSRHVYPYYYGLASLCGHKYHAIMQDPSADYGRLVNSRVSQSFADSDLQWKTQNESFQVDVEAVKAMMAKFC